MNCCRGERGVIEESCQKYGDVFREILIQIPNATYAAIYDRSAGVLTAEYYFGSRDDERFADQGSHIRYNVEPLMGLLKRSKDIGSIVGESADPSTMLLTTSMGYVFCILSVACIHSLIVATLFDPSDVSEMSTLIFELRLRGVVNRLGPMLTSRNSLSTQG